MNDNEQTVYKIADHTSLFMIWAKTVDRADQDFENEYVSTSITTDLPTVWHTKTNKGF